MHDVIFWVETVEAGGSRLFLLQANGHKMKLHNHIRVHT